MHCGEITTQYTKNWGETIAISQIDKLIVQMKGNQTCFHRNIIKEIDSNITTYKNITEITLTISILMYQ